jgi:hypothetical protein
MRITTNKMRRFLYLMVTGLVMSAAIVPLSALTSKSVSARAQRPASIKTGAFTDATEMLSRIFPFYKVDSWINKDRKGIDLRSFLLKSGLSDKLIAPVQEPGKTSVTFKGFITREGVAREGNVKLVLRIYDQADGGTKLYEGIHEAKVIHSQYFAQIQIPSEYIAKSKTVWVEAAGDEKELAFEPRQAFTVAPEATATTIPYYVRSVALCFICGGDAPSMNGGFYVPPEPSGIHGQTNGVNNNTFEFGSGCSGRQAWKVDHFPELCVGATFLQ